MKQPEFYTDASITAVSAYLAVAADDPEILLKPIKPHASAEDYEIVGNKVQTLLLNLIETLDSAMSPVAQGGNQAR